MANYSSLLSYAIILAFRMELTYKITRLIIFLQNNLALPAGRNSAGHLLRSQYKDDRQYFSLCLLLNHFSHLMSKQTEGASSKNPKIFYHFLRKFGRTNIGRTFHPRYAVVFSLQNKVIFAWWNWQQTAQVSQLFLNWYSQNTKSMLFLLSALLLQVKSLSEREKWQLSPFWSQLNKSDSDSDFKDRSIQQMIWWD